MDIDTPSLLRGVKDALAGTTPVLTDAEVDVALKQLSGQVQAKQDAETAKIGEANMKEGEEFLAANKTKDGVVTLPSGLQYKIVTAGTGAKPTAKDTVVCNYRGTFINGTEFDSSYKRGQPASFPVGGVIKGWTEALQLMPVGSKWQLFVPPDLAYGAARRRRGDWSEPDAGFRCGADLDQGTVGRGASEPLAGRAAECASIGCSISNLHFPGGGFSLEWRSANES